MDDKTREVLDGLFEFEIGELVYFRTAVGAVLGREHPTMFQITERRLQQCPGGIQLSYVVGGHLNLHHEIELTRDVPVGRKLTADEADGIRDYRKRTGTASWSDMLPEATKDAE